MAEKNHWLIIAPAACNLYALLSAVEVGYSVATPITDQPITDWLLTATITLSALVALNEAYEIIYYDKQAVIEHLSGQTELETVDAPSPATPGALKKALFKAFTYLRHLCLRAYLFLSLYNYNNPDSSQPRAVLPIGTFLPGLILYFILFTWQFTYYNNVCQTLSNETIETRPTVTPPAGYASLEEDVKDIEPPRQLSRRQTASLTWMLVAGIIDFVGLSLLALFLLSNEILAHKKMGHWFANEYSSAHMALKLTVILGGALGASLVGPCLIAAFLQAYLYEGLIARKYYYLAHGVPAKDRQDNPVSRFMHKHPNIRRAFNGFLYTTPALKIPENSFPNYQLLRQTLDFSGWLSLSTVILLSLSCVFVERFTRSVYVQKLIQPTAAPPTPPRSAC
jgi:hypothetical protein